MRRIGQLSAVRWFLDVAEDPETDVHVRHDAHQKLAFVQPLTTTDPVPTASRRQSF
jgi:hypothetical protein